MFRKILGASLVMAIVLVMMPGIVGAATIGVVLTPTIVNQGQSVTVSGSCGTALANMSSQINLLSSSGTSVTANYVTDNGGNFVQSIGIPLTFPAGTATIRVTCPDNFSESSALTINVPIGTTLTINGTPTIGLGTAISGSCGTVAAGTPVSLSLVRNGTTTSLGSTTTTGTNGSFSATFTIPSNFSGGPVNFVANCPGGPINFASSIFNPSASVAVSGAPFVIGGPVSISGVCGDTSGTANMTLTSANGTSISLPSITSGSTGTFTSSINVPSSFPTGNATLTVNCPGGRVATTSFTLDPRITGTVGGTTTSNTGGTTGNAAATTGTVSTTPTGGVAAGKTENTIELAGLAMLIVGGLGVVLSRKLQYGDLV